MGSADFLHFLAVFYFQSVMLKGNIFIFKHLIVFQDPTKIQMLYFSMVLKYDYHLLYTNNETEVWDPTKSEALSTLISGTFYL